jgi:starch-binding outer membrane protein, SusD/RagB family
MKTMKNKIVCYIVLLISGLTSCKDYLEVKSPSAFDSEYVFSSTSDALKMIYSVYSCFPVDAYTSRMSCVFMMNTDVEAAYPGTAIDGSRRDIWAFQPSYSFADIKTTWNICYLAIDRANQCIEGIKASALYAGGDKDMKQMLGEAYCLRAYWYFLLCNYWGDVPLALEASKAGMNLNTPRVDKDSIYSIIIQDLIDHEADMKWAADLSGGIERMNREFAIGMIARLSLFRGGYSMQYDGTMQRKSDYLSYYQIAKTYCQKLISLKDRDLNSDFKQIFLNECQFLTPADDDVLFEVAYVTNNGGDVGWCIGLSVVAGEYGAGTSYLYFPTTYYYSFDPNDKRLPVTCSLYQYQTYNSASSFRQGMLSPTTINPSKWSRAWLKTAPGSTSTKGTGINWPLMRYSDVLLMLAEADNEISGAPTDLAKNALKRVRNRAFAAADRSEKVENYVNALTSKEDFFDAIVNERAWEFGGECLRKFDLVRWNLYGKKIVETKTKLLAMGMSGNAASGYEQYDNLADVLYYRVDNGAISFYNTPYARVTAPTLYDVDDDNKTDTPAGKYWKKSWTKALVTKDATTGVYSASDYIKYNYRGYTDETGASAVPYLLPIHQDIIAASSGVLSNDGYGLKIQ